MHDDLWGYACALYARPGVEAASLELQQAGADICVLLCAAWLGQRGVPCQAHYLARLQTSASPWQKEVIGPLRDLRQQWRAAAQLDPQLARLRERLKALELDAEEQLLARLEALCKAWPQTGAGDLERWLERALPTQAKANRDALQTLRAAIETA